MLIQAFAVNTVDVKRALEMIYNYYKNFIKVFHIRETKSVREPYYRNEFKQNIDDVMKDLDDNYNQDVDNIGVYYNDGETVFISIFRNAKFDLDAYS